MTNMFKRFFQDDKGRYVVVQWPNAPVYMILASSLLSRMDLGSDAQRLFELTTFGSIFLWAFLEITQGESTFRRVLGAGVMVWLLGTTSVNV